MGGGGGSSGGGFFKKAKDWVKDKAEKIWSWFRGSSSSSSSSISQEAAYDMNSAELQQTLRINKSLEEFRSTVSEGSDKIEHEIVEICWNQIDELMAFLKSINNKEYCGTRLKLNLSAMERENREIINGIYGSVRKDVLAKVNIDNPDCERILLMEAGAAKRNEMKNFMDEAVRASINNLTKKLKNSLNKSCDGIEDRIEVRLSDINDNVEAKMKAFNEFSSLAKGDRQKLEEKRIAVSKQMAEYSIWLNLIDQPVKH